MSDKKIFCAEQAEALWNKSLSIALRTPGIKVNREKYLKKTLSKYYPMETVLKAIETTPASQDIPKEMIDSIADSSIKFHLFAVTSISVALGVPGKIGYLFGTIPADFSQILWHTIVLIQKLCYLYGWPQFFDSDDVDDETKNLLILFLGAMYGVQSARAGIAQLSQMVAKEIVKRLPRKALTKYSVYVVTKQIARLIGIKITKLIFAKTIAKAPPIIGGAISGALSYMFFKKCAKNLKNHLRELILAETNNSNNNDDNTDD